MDRGSLLPSLLATIAGCCVIVVVGLLGLAARSAAGAAPPGRPLPRRDPRPMASPQHWRRPLVLTTTIAVAGGLTATIGPTLVVVLTGGGILARRRRHRAGEVARRRAVEASLPDAVELLVLCVHAGRSPTQAVVELAHRGPTAIRPGFAAVEHQLHRGRGLADALAVLVDTLGPPARDLAAVVATADREGLPLAPMLDRLALDARAARRRQGETAARRLPVRLSFPLVTCTLPAFVLMAIAPAVLGALSTLRATAP